MPGKFPKHAYFVFVVTLMPYLLTAYGPNPVPENVAFAPGSKTASRSSTNACAPWLAPTSRAVYIINCLCDGWTVNHYVGDLLQTMT